MTIHADAEYGYVERSVLGNVVVEGDALGLNVLGSAVDDVCARERML